MSRLTTSAASGALATGAAAIALLGARRAANAAPPVSQGLAPGGTICRLVLSSAAGSDVLEVDATAAGVLRSYFPRRPIGLPSGSASTQTRAPGAT
jgi:hypothetical protein